MKSPLLYLLEVLFCSGLMTAVYRLLLVRKVSLAACRWFLLAAVLLPVLLPALDIPVYPARSEVSPPAVVPAADAEPAAEWPVVAAVPADRLPAAAPAVGGGEGTRRVRRAGAALYAVVSALLLSLFALRLRRIVRLRRRARLTDCGCYVLAEHPAVESPFSFLRTVFLGEGFEGRRREIVLCHEASHVRRHHSLERILVEIVRCLFWFNPFVWIAQRDLAEVQEWEADRDVLDAGYDLTEYRTVIFRQLFGYNPDIACGLNHSLTKNRFVMMTQFKRGRYAFVRLGAVVPVVAAMTMLCSFTTREAVAEEPAEIVSTVHIGPDGRITMNGEPRSLQEVRDFVAEERAKLPEADRGRMELRLTIDRAAAMPTVSVAGGELRLDGEAVTLEELETELRDRRGKLSPEVFGQMELRIVAEGDERMGRIDDVRQVLRRVPWLRVRYELAGGRMAILRMLPPAAATATEGPVKVLMPLSEDAPADGKTAAVELSRRNLLQVRVNDSGEILAGNRSVGTDPAALADEVEAFARNAAGRTDAAECAAREFPRPDGRSVSWPVSRGVVSVQVAGTTSYRSYVAVQRALTEAFDRIREEVAQEWFGRPAGELTEAERAVVLRAVPLKIFEEEPRRIG